jgi:hypothetical protein
MRDAGDDYGLKISRALAAVRRMHADVSKLLVDADGTIGKNKDSVFGNWATRDLNYKPRADYWMSWFVYRYYAGGEAPGIVDGLSVWFFDSLDRINEPHLLVGQLSYDLAPDQQIGKVCQEYDLVHAYVHWSGQPAPRRVLAGRRPAQKPAVNWYKVIAVPLYAITSMDDVTGLMKQVRDTEVPSTTEGQP